MMFLAARADRRLPWLIAASGLMLAAGIVALVS
jgi:hypothetical protein